MLKFWLVLLMMPLWVEGSQAAAQTADEAASPREGAPPRNAGDTGQDPAKPESRKQQFLGRLKSAASQGEPSPPVYFREGPLVEFLPYAGTIRDGSGPSFGVIMNATGLTPLRFELSGTARVSTRGYQWHGVQLGRLRDRRRTFQVDPLGSRFADEFNEWGRHSRGVVVYGDANFRSFRREDYFGTGPAALEDERTNYHFRGSSFDLVTGLQFNRWVGLSVRGGFVGPDLDRGRNPDLPELQERFEGLPGMDRQPWFFRVTSALLLDYRDEPGNPHRGGMLGLFYSRFDDRGGNDFAFNRYGIDIRQFLPIFSDRNVLALHASSLADEPLRNQSVPFYFQESIGGGACLRGFRDFRFRDDKLLCLSSEFRRELNRTLEVAVFYDAGKVFPDWSDLHFRGLERGYGAGFRVKTERFVLFRLDVGRSREGTRAHFKLGRSF
jgi:hypothetical protein